MSRGHHDDVTNKCCSVTIPTSLVEWTLSLSEINVYSCSFQELSGFKNTNDYANSVGWKQNDMGGRHSRPQTRPSQGFPQLTLSVKTDNFSLQIMFTLRPFDSAIVLYFSSKFVHMHLCGIHYRSYDQTFVKPAVSEIMRQLTVTMHAAGLMGVARSPAACMNHQFSMATQAWCGDPQQPERHPLAQTTYDVFVTLAYYRELHN